MKQKIRSFLMIFAIGSFLTGCSFSPVLSPKEKTPERKQYQATFLDLFDTVTSIVGYAESEEAFHEMAQPIHDQLLEYHQLFDIYHNYDGINNLKTINDQAGIAAVAVDERIIDLLLDCREFYEATDGKINAAMGSVLSLWHEARTEGRDDPRSAKLPDAEKLAQAGEHISFDAVLIDEENNTVFIEDPQVRLDVGAIAKGWTAQRVAEQITEEWIEISRTTDGEVTGEQPEGQVSEGLLISLGGNICATGPKDKEGTPWVIGIQDPDKGADQYLHTVYVTKGSVVTSGDYQRVYVVDGKSYHHIIDPETRYPSEYWRAVSIVCEDSGVADMLSTALFLLPQEEGQELLDRYGAVALWVDPDGSIFYSPGFKELLRT